MNEIEIEILFKKLDEIIKLLKSQNNLLDSLHNLFNQYNKDYLIEIHKDGLIE